MRRTFESPLQVAIRIALNTHNKETTMTTKPPRIISMSKLHADIATALGKAYLDLVANDDVVRCRDLDMITVGPTGRFDHLTRSEVVFPVTCGRAADGRFFIALRVLIQSDKALPGARFNDVDVFTLHQVDEGNGAHWTASGVMADMLGLRNLMSHGDTIVVDKLVALMRRQQPSVTVTNHNGVTYELSLDEAR